MTALMHASMHDDVGVVKTLIDAGADVRARDETGWSALMHATRRYCGNAAVVQLLIRSTHLVAATDAGHQLLAKAESLLAHYDEVGHALRAEQARPRGSLRVSAMTSFGQRYIAPLLPAFLERYPEVQVFIDLSNRLVNLADENFDVGIRMGVPQDSALRARALAPASAVLAASPAYLQRHGAPGEPEDLRQHNCLAINAFRRQTYWYFQRQGQSQRVGVAGNLQSASGEPLVAAACAGLGVVLMAGWMLRRELDTGALTPLLREWQGSIYEGDTAGVYAVFRNERFQRPAVRAFIDFLAEVVPSALAPGAAHA